MLVLLLYLMEQHQILYGGVLRISVPLLDLNQLGQKLKNARNVIFGSFLTFRDPSQLQSPPQLTKGVVLLFPIGQISQKLLK